MLPDDSILHFYKYSNIINISQSLYTGLRFYLGKYYPNSV